MITKSDQKYFSKARKIAGISDYARVHIGCVAVYQGNIVGIGCNTNKIHPAQEYYNRYRVPKIRNGDKWLIPKMHAEVNCINAIKNLDINFSKVKLYIYRIRNDRPFGMSHPCPSCMAAIRDTGIENIYYTTDVGYVSEIIKL